MRQTSVHRLLAGKGFTLIELLIVIAIIAILALIAVPNFLEAQTRAKVSRIYTDLRTVSEAIQAYYMDEGNVPPDGNDGEGVHWAGWTFQRETGIAPDMAWATGFPEGLKTITKFAPFNMLTSPTAYISSVPIDAFSNVMPFTYDTLGYYPMAYCVVISAGPDRTLGHWYRDLPANNGTARPYDPTNGTMSTGDVWRAPVMLNQREYVRHYSGFFMPGRDY